MNISWMCSSKKEEIHCAYDYEKTSCKIDFD
jgi:hypothetical protein